MPAFAVVHAHLAGGCERHLVRRGAAVNRLWLVKAHEKRSHVHIRHRVAPFGRHFPQRPEHEIPSAKGDMRDLQGFIGPYPAAPQYNIEVERARGPALPALPPEMGFDRLKPCQKLRWRQIACHNRGGIGISAARWPERRAADDVRACPDAQRWLTLHVECRPYERVWSERA